jgi:hypothetical protein
VTAAVLGIELGPRTLRAVRLDGWRAMRTSVLEVAWDGEHPDDAVRAVRDGLGRARRVAVAVPLALLVAKRVRLPPLPAGERRRILRLEPQRFFAVRLEEMAVAVRDDDFVFATREAPLAAWLRALEALGPVELVEPGPVSLARGLAAAGVADGVAVLDDPEHGLGMVELRGGEVTVARRPFGPLDVAAAAVREAADTDGAPRRVYVEPWSEARAGVLAAPGARSTAEPFPASGPVAGPFLTAYGAARGDGRDLAATLAPEELGARILARRRRVRGGAVLGCAAAAAFALASLDAWRERGARVLAERVAALERRAAPVAALQREVAALDRRARAVAQLRAARTDPLAVLSALSTRLPVGAYVRSVRATGADWQVDGYALQAAGVLEGLSQGPPFRDVHFLSATNRVQVNERDYESFSVAFRVVPAP